MNRMVILPCLLALISLKPLVAQELPANLAAKGDLRFADDFQRNDLGEWKVIIPGFKVADGVLVGSQDRDDHGSVGRLYLPMKDVMLSFRFKLAGSPRFNVVFDDKDYKGSHAGHICRVAVTPNQIRLGDDKEGIMRNDIFEMRRDPKRKSAADRLLEGRAYNAKVTLEKNRWYNMDIQLLDDQMLVRIDGTVVGWLQSPGIDHPTKRSVHFTVSGKETLFDDVRIWDAVAMQSRDAS